MERHLTARVKLENARAASSTVRLVDGRMAKLTTNNAGGHAWLKPQRTAAAEAKTDHLVEIRMARWRDRMRQDLVAIIGGPLIRDPMAKHPAWSITRIAHSPDLRHCQVYWSIGDEAERQVFKVVQKYLLAYFTLGFHSNGP